MYDDPIAIQRAPQPFSPTNSLAESPKHHQCYYSYFYYCYFYCSFFS